MTRLFDPVSFKPEMLPAFVAWPAPKALRNAPDAGACEAFILTAGVAWQADNQLRVHAAVARKAGLVEQAIGRLCVGEPTEDLGEAKRTARACAAQLTASRRICGNVFVRAIEVSGTRGMMDRVGLPGACQT
ncbi:hypothetical protein FGG78_27960, partial [Thioclava sp. BHET1]